MASSSDGGHGPHLGTDILSHLVATVMQPPVAAFARGIDWTALGLLRRNLRLTCRGLRDRVDAAITSVSLKVRTERAGNRWTVDGEGFVPVQTVYTCVRCRCRCNARAGDGWGFGVHKRGSPASRSLSVQMCVSPTDIYLLHALMLNQCRSPGRPRLLRSVPPVARWTCAPWPPRPHCTRNAAGCSAA